MESRIAGSGFLIIDSENPNLYNYRECKPACTGLDCYEPKRRKAGSSIWIKTDRREDREMSPAGARECIWDRGPAAVPSGAVPVHAREAAWDPPAARRGEAAVPPAEEGPGSEETGDPAEAAEVRSA